MHDFKERLKGHQAATKSGRRQIAEALEMRADDAPEPGQRKGGKRKKGKRREIGDGALVGDLDAG